MYIRITINNKSNFSFAITSLFKMYLYLTNFVISEISGFHGVKNEDGCL
jgi:hypothetical protein